MGSNKELKNIRTSTKLALGDQETVGMFVAGSFSRLCSSQFINDVVSLKSKGLTT
jgi:hypothetical protein